jgi:L-alanine-DL-glutamate epimerase-like enolase superfamily enzyme
LARRLNVRIERWPLRRPFRISRGVKSEIDVVVAEIEDRNDARRVTGRGEAVPYPRYGETARSVMNAIAQLDAAVTSGLDRAALARMLPAGAARNALDCALWDLQAKETGRRVWELAGLVEPGPVVTAETIGIGSCAEMAEAARQLRHRSLLKVKLDGEEPLERTQAVRQAAPDARLIVDANEAWDLATLDAVSPGLAALGVELIEQPLPAGSDHLLRGRSAPVPVCADESCHTEEDLDRLAGCYQFINVKLDKSGGLTAAAELLRSARGRGFGTMVGCMVCTSLATAPALLLAAGANYADLDGPLWLARDREPGMIFSAGIAHPPPPALWG